MVSLGDAVNDEHNEQLLFFPIILYFVSEISPFELAIYLIITVGFLIGLRNNNTD